MRRSLLAASLAASFVCSCSSFRGCVDASADDPHCSTELTERYLAQNQDRYRAAIDAATRWLDDLPVDPVELRRQGHKGKKHFVEALDTYARLVEIASATEKTVLMERVRKLASVTDQPAYHDMLTNDDRSFKQDATSYLRAALLMERLGLDTTRYRGEIKKIEGRLNDHMKLRGVHQRMVFSWYYRHFGLREPFPLASAYRRGVVANRLPTEKYTRARIYDLTHEVFSPYEYGDKLDADPFDDDEKLYLRATLAALVKRQIQRNDPDLVAELVACMRYLRFMDLPEYGAGLAFLLLSQRSNGSWGNYDARRERFGDLVDQAFVLHTTTVAVEALVVAFHEPWSRGIDPWCPPSRPAAPAVASSTAPADAGDSPLDEDDAAPEEP